MNFFEILYMLIVLVLSIPVLGYARYLHDDAENRLGALAVLLLVIVTGIGAFQINR